MKREVLKSLGLEDDVIDKIMAENGKDINELKAKLSELETQATEYQKQVAERDTQLESLKKSAGDSQELQQQIATLIEANKLAKEEYDAKVKQMAIDNAVTLALTNAKVKDVKLGRAMLDLTNAEMDGDTVKGLAKQIDKLKESHDYIFETETKPSITGVKPAEGTGQTQKPFNKMTYSERAAYLEAGGKI